MKQLPDAPWRIEPGLIAVIAALRDADGVDQCRYVGGAVRDTLLGNAVMDVDLATPLLPGEVSRRLVNAGLKAVPTGIDHGTITAVADGRGYEITTLRRDVSTDGRRATVEFSDRWEEDAARRDFTINALYASPVTGEIFDYFGGLSDLTRRHVRFIGDPAARIAEDNLRILRYFRFLSRFGERQLDAPAFAACRSAAASLKSLSRERIAAELLQLLGTAAPSFVIGQMREAGIFEAFLPELREDAECSVARLTTRETLHAIAPTGLRRLAAVLPVDAALADQVAARLKLSRRARQTLSTLFALQVATPANIRATAYYRGVEAARDAALLFATDHDLEAAMGALAGWEPPVFPLKGGDLVRRGIGQGPQVARTLRAIEEQWIAEGFPDAVRVAHLADQAAALSGSEQ